MEKEEAEGKRKNETRRRQRGGHPDKSNSGLMVVVYREAAADVVDVGIACRANVVPVCTYPVVKASLYLLDSAPRRDRLSPPPPPPRRSCH